MCGYASFCSFFVFCFLEKIACLDTELRWVSFNEIKGELELFFIFIFTI